MPCAAERDHRRRPALAAVALVLLTALAPAPARAGDLWELSGGRESALVTAGLATATGAVLTARSQPPLTEAELAGLDREHLWWLDRPAADNWSPTADRASDVVAYTLLASPAVLFADTGSEMSSGELAVMYGETLLLEMATVGLVKSLVARPRPFVYNDDPRIPPELKRSRTAARSFPSGHTANAFAGAVFLGEVYARLHPDDPARHWVRGSALAVAAVCGWLRIEAGRHFPSDVLVGAVIGTLAGWGIPRLHEVDPATADKSSPTPGLVFGFSF